MSATAIGFARDVLDSAPRPAPLDTALVFRDRCLTATAESATWAAAHLEDLKERVRFSEKEVEHRTASDGSNYRQAFTISCAPGFDDYFVIKLFKGASEQDLTSARRFINMAKRGIFHAPDWKRIEKFSNQPFGGWTLNLFLQHDESPEQTELRECDEPDCIAEFHAWWDGKMDDPHMSDFLSDTNHWYNVRCFKEDGAPWKVFLDLEGLDSLEGPEDLSLLERMLGDYRWMLIECDRLNAGQEAAA